MELEDLKSKWKSVRPNIEPHINDEIVRRSISKGNDVKSRILRRSLWSQILVSISLILMATSRIWSPLKLPYWWIGLFCTTILIMILYSIKGYRTLKKMDIYKDSNTKILKTIITIKREYRNLELIGSGVILTLMLWMSFIPSFIYTWRMYYVWGLTALAFILECIWYKSNVKQFNQLLNLDKE